jgi:Arc/MetJ-type ribon-helix-helix transcriptional regulator
MSDPDKSKPVRGSRRTDRSERLAAALRANLKRRKAQARGRADLPEAAAAGKDEPETKSPEAEDR